MYKRFRDSLSNPRGLVAYRKDRLWFVFLYLFLFALLMGTRTFIDVATYDGLSFAYQENVKENFETVDGRCDIVDGVYTCEVEESQFVYEDIGIRFFLDSYDSFSRDRYADEQYAVVVHKEYVRFLFNGTMMYEQELASISNSLNQLDFALQETDPELFYDTLLGGVSDYLVRNKWAWGFGAVLVEVLLGLLLFVFFAVVNSYFMYRRFMLIKYRDVLVMTVYASTALFVVLIFDQMFQFSFFITLLLIFVAFRQNSQLNDELMQRMMKHQMKVQEEQKEKPDEENDETEDIEEEDDFDKFE
ncbi:MAG: DUF1189 family protein [Candidatus Izemoplasmataceae bacterium]